MRTSDVGLAALLVAAAPALVTAAVFTASHAGPLPSDGPLGSAGNGRFASTYTGPRTILGGVHFGGTVSSGGVGSYLTETRWNVRNVTGDVSVVVRPFMAGTTWTGSRTASVDQSVFLWAATGDHFAYEAFETLNDGGIDAVWTDVSFTFTAAPVTSIGSFRPGELTFSLAGSGFDTEMALYTGTGSLLASNDDFGDNLQSQVRAELASGDYWVLVGGFNSSFAERSASPGTASGSFTLGVDGVTKASGVLPAGAFAVYTVTITAVPEPSTWTAGAGVVAWAAWAAFRRRRGGPGRPAVDGRAPAVSARRSPAR